LRLHVLKDAFSTYLPWVRLLLVGTALSTMLRPAAADDLAQAWAVEAFPADVSAQLTGACASPRGLLLVSAVSAPDRDAPRGSFAVRVDAEGKKTERELSARGSKEGLRNVRACVDAGDGYLLIGTTGRDSLTAWWLSADLETSGSIELSRDPSSTMVWGLTTLDSGRFAAVLDHEQYPILIFDRETVLRVRPGWPADKTRRLYDVTSVGDGIFVCGIEGDRGDDPKDPSFVNPKILVATFATDGSERATALFEGRTCRLFSGLDGSIALLHQPSSEVLSGLQLTRLDRELKALESKKVLNTHRPRDRRRRGRLGAIRQRRLRVECGGGDSLGWNEGLSDLSDYTIRHWPRNPSDRAARDCVRREIGVCGWVCRCSHSRLQPVPGPRCVIAESPRLALDPS
jgi:hypothetical protein